MGKEECKHIHIHVIWCPVYLFSVETAECEHTEHSSVLFVHASPSS